mgnify:FL=1|tara:strand:- start:511 stop:1383 length:873 start_codon:yes stop_codon:yes gene_type:complete
MPKVPTQTSDYDFTVEQVPLFDAQGRRTGFFGNQRTDNGIVLGVTSERYGIQNNAPLIERAEEAFNDQGLGDFEREVIVTGDGQRMRAVYDFKNQIKPREDRKKGDNMGLRLTVQNSFDRSLRVSFAMGVLRLVCTNGMTSLEREQSMTKKHSSGNGLDFLGEALSKAIGSWDKALLTYNQLEAVEIEQQQGLNALHNLAKAGAISDRMAGAVSKIWNNPTYTEDEGRNLYNLYNAVTEHLTREVEGTRYELAERVNQKVLSRLDQAARSGAKKDKLLLLPKGDTISFAE